MEENPKRFSEVSPDVAPPGSRFPLGHSVEDWMRALACWSKLRTQRMLRRESDPCLFLELQTLDRQAPFAMTGLLPPAGRSS